MPITLPELEALREGWDIEVKKAAGQDGRGRLPNDFWPTYSAMANTRGGRVLLGVTEREDGSLQVHGLSDPHRVERDLWNLLQNREKASANLLSQSQVRIEEVQETGGRRILVVDIPQAPRHLRPVHIGKDPFTGTYIRVHEGDRLADRERVRRMFADADPDGVDGRVQEHYTLGDLDPGSMERYRNLLSARRPDHPFLDVSGLEFLRQIRAWGRDHETGREGPTLAGLLVFGRENSIRDRLDRFHLDYREVSEMGAIRWEDRVVPDGTWNANLLEFYRRVIEKIHSRLRVPFQLGPDLLRRDETPIHEALRESLVNTIIHADYTTGNGIRVFQAPGSFRFINPGSLLLPLDQIRTGGESACRNRTLQHLFGLLGAGERAGSGFPTILSAWRKQHWQMPALRENVEKEETSLELSMDSLFPSGTFELLRERFSSRFDELDDSGRTVMALALVAGPVDHTRLNESVDLHSRDLTLLLQSLIRKGVLERQGHGRGCFYRLPDVEPSQSSEGSAPNSEGSSSEGNSEGSPPNSEGSPPNSEGSPPNSEGSPPNSEGSPPNSEGSFPKHSHLLAGRSCREDVKAAIEDLCLRSALTLPELASALERHPVYLRQEYLRPMVEQGRLALRFPNAPNHPQQAYQTVRRREEKE